MLASGDASMVIDVTDLVVFACSQQPLQLFPSLEFQKTLLPLLQKL